MADATATAQLKITADASQAIRETDRLTKSQETLSKSVSGVGSGFVKALDGMAMGLAKFNLALGGVQKAFALVNGAIDMASSDARLRSMEKLLPTGSVDKFREATYGMVKSQEIARLSVKGMTGDFAMNGAQMEKLLKTAVALQEKGFGPAAEIADKLIESLGEKGVDRLDDFGIALTKTADKAGDNARAYAEFDKILAGSRVSDEAKQVAKLSAALDDFSVAVKSVVGVAVQGFVSLGEAIGEVLAEYTLQRFGMTGHDFSKFADKKDQDAHWKARAAETAAYNERMSKLRGETAGMVRDWASSYYTSDADKKALGGRWDTQGLEYLEADNRRKQKPGAWVDPRDYGRAGGVVIGGEEGLGYGALPGGVDPGMGSGLLNQAGNHSRLAGPGGAANGGFGNEDRLKDITAQLGDTSTAVGVAFSTISSGVIAAVDAAISGSDSIGRAAAKASAAVLRSLSIESAGRALYEGALALGSLAIGDTKGAALHGMAAGKYLLAAAGTGAFAAALGAAAGSGGGGGGGAAGGGYARPGGSVGGSSGGGGGNITINIGDGFYGDPKAVGEAVGRAVRKAQLAGGTRDTYATRASG